MKKVLLDTHILIQRESDRTIDRHLQEVMKYAGALHYDLVIHPRSIKEINIDKNIADSKKGVLLSKIGTYLHLDSLSNPLDDEDFIETIQGLDLDNFREVGDAFLLYSLYKKEVDLLLTEDSDLTEKARLLNISGKVMTLKHAAMSFKAKRPSDVPVFHFYKEGDFWYIGEEGKRILRLEHLDGFKYIHFLLDNEGKEFVPLVVFHGGKKMMGGQGLDRELSVEEREHLGLQDGEAINLYSKRDRRKSKRAIEREIAQLREGLDPSLSPDERLVIEEEIKDRETRLNNIPERDPKSPEELCRTNLTNRIKVAKKTIKKHGALASIYEHLKATITTGDDFSYVPRDTEKPIWILDPDSE